VKGTKQAVFEGRWAVMEFGEKLNSKREGFLVAGGE
jgi:hypothetical protein